MPTYEYECTKCGHIFEKFHSMLAEPVKRCPKCRCKVRKLLGTGAGIIFKGSGFYQTDYRNDAYNKAAKKDSDMAKGDTKKAKPDTKPSKKRAKGTAGSKSSST